MSGQRKGTKAEIELDSPAPTPNAASAAGRVQHAAAAKKALTLATTPTVATLPSLPGEASSPGRSERLVVGSVKVVSKAVSCYLPPVATTGSSEIVMGFKNLSIGELSRKTGVKIETIRYFERIGTVATPSRTEGGHRVYGEEHLRALGFIRRARDLGFTPEEVRGILNLGGPGNACCDEVRDIAAHHLEQVRFKMADLAHMERLLTATIEGCSGEHAPQCAVIDMIEGGGNA